MSLLKVRITKIIWVAFVCILTTEAIAQRPSIANADVRPGGMGSTPADRKDARVHVSGLPKNILLDQAEIWTAPLRLRGKDLEWAVPFAFGAAITFGVDQAAQRELPSDPSTIKRASSFSNYGAAALGGTVAASYLWGHYTHNERLRETGILGTEAAVDAMIVGSALKLATRRERPTEGLGQGRFFEGSGFGSSFPSQHAAASWAIASVLAKEYPGPLTKLFAYGGASAISVSRIVGRKHFASDVLIGAAMGWYVGERVYESRSSAERNNIGTFVRDAEQVNHRSLASSYVPLDSWIYPAFSRLNALGLVPSSLIGLRPWTRMECARLLDAVQEDPELQDRGEEEAPELLAAMRSEFSYELRVRNGEQDRRAQFNEVYTRSTVISGAPLNDSLHFAQTIVNDFGRQYQEGMNQLVGSSAVAEDGRFGVYVRGEYQYTPSSDALPSAARAAIARFNGLPVMPDAPVESLNRFRLLDSYVALNLSDWQFSFGKQSLWWGPTEGGDLMMSSNAEPLWMLRLSRVSPLKLPGLLHFLGPLRTESFLGQIQGYHFLKIGPNFDPVGSWTTGVNPQPYIWGVKTNFKLTSNLEFGFSMTTVFAGLGRPMTLDTFVHTFSSRGNAQNVEPGDRRTGFDFAYRFPGLRRWVTLYNGSLADDEPNPIAYPRRSAMNPGIYITHLPKLPKLDFRAEGVYTNLPGLISAGFFYNNGHYSGGYTNYGELMGSWVGPQGQGLQLWSTYWFRPRQTLRLGWREQVVDHSYLQGGNLHNYSAEYKFPFLRGWAANTSVQFERENFPALSPVPRNNVAVSITLTYHTKQGRDLPTP